MWLFLHGCTASLRANFKLRKVCSHLSQFGGYFASFLYIALVLVRFASVLFHLPSLAPDSLFATLFSTVSPTSPALAPGFLLLLLGLLILALYFFFFLQCKTFDQPPLSFVFFSFKIPPRKDGTLPLQAEGAFLCKSMAAMSDSTVVVVAVVHTCPRAIPLALTMFPGVHFPYTLPWKFLSAFFSHFLLWQRVFLWTHKYTHHILYKFLRDIFTWNFLTVRKAHLMGNRT